MSDSSEETTLGGATREAARDRAKVIREQHRKQERRRRLIVTGSIAGGVIAVIAVVAIIIVSTIRPPSSGPLNMLSDGVLVGPLAQVTPTDGIPAGGDPVATTPLPDATSVSIVVYTDYLSPESGEFIAANSDQISTWLDSGAATTEFHPLALLSSRNGGYSSRAANAAACVANFDPNAFLSFNRALFEAQPVDDSTGSTDAELVSLATGAGATQEVRIRDCIAEDRFGSWVRAATDRALAGPLPASEVEAIVETPTVLVNGIPYSGAPGDDAAFASFVLQAAGAQFNEDSAPTATPTPEAPVETPATEATPTESPAP